MAFRINQQAIDNWIVWLNKAHGPGTWTPLVDFNTPITVTYNSTGGAIFDNHKGYIVKGFINSATGEVKWFDARRFYSL